MMHKWADIFDIFDKFVMDSTIPEGASKNPYQQYLQTFADMPRDQNLVGYRKHGSYGWIEIPEQIRDGVSKSVINIQNLLLPTVRHLRNERNISQLQGRVYRKLKVYEDQFNTCHLASRNINEAFLCGEVLLGRLNNQMPVFVKKVLDEY